MSMETFIIIPAYSHTSDALAKKVVKGFIFSNKRCEYSRSFRIKSHSLSNCSSYRETKVWT